MNAKQRRILDNMGKTTDTPCMRCCGAGRIRCFAHYNDGICFDCEGSGGLHGAHLSKAGVAAVAAMNAPKPVKVDNLETLKIFCLARAEATTDPRKAEAFARFVRLGNVKHGCRETARSTVVALKENNMETWMVEMLEEIAAECDRLGIH